MEFFTSVLQEAFNIMRQIKIFAYHVMGNNISSIFVMVS